MPSPEEALIRDQANNIEQLLELVGSCEDGYLPTLPNTNVGVELAALFQKCGTVGSDEGVALCRRLIRKHPGSGLAYYLLFTALAARLKTSGVTEAMKAEASNAIAKARSLGCKYITSDGRGGFLESTIIE